MNGAAKRSNKRFSVVSLTVTERIRVGAENGQSESSLSRAKHLKSNQSVLPRRATQHSLPLGIWNGWFQVRFGSLFCLKDHIPEKVETPELCDASLGMYTRGFPALSGVGY